MTHYIRITWRDGDVTYYKASSISALFSWMNQVGAAMGEITEAKVLPEKPNGLGEKDILDITESV